MEEPQEEIRAKFRFLKETCYERRTESFKVLKLKTQTFSMEQSVAHLYFTFAGGFVSGCAMACSTLPRCSGADLKFVPINRQSALCSTET